MLEKETVATSGELRAASNLTEPAEAEPIEIESLEAIGIFPVGKSKPPASAAKRKPVQPEIPGSISLKSLLSKESCRILSGEDTKGDRSASLTAFSKDAFGCENWCNAAGIGCFGSAEKLISQAGEGLGIDSDRVDRILATVDSASCQPSSWFKGGDEAIWQKIKQLDNATYLAKCPQTIIKEQSQQAATNNRWNCLQSHNHELGLWREVKRGKGTDTETERVFEPLADFDFQVERVLESSEGGGLVLQVEQIISGQLTKSRVIISSVAMTKVNDFVNVLKREIKRNICCLLKQDDLQRLIHERTEEYWSKGERTYRLIDRIGQQPDGIWVFENYQFTQNGELMTEEESGWVWNPAMGEIEKIPSPKIVDPDRSALPKLAEAAQGFFHAETLPLLWLTCGFTVAALNWQQIMQAEGKFPQCSLFGDPGGGKSTAANIAMSLVGLQDKAMQRFSESVAFEHSKLLSGLLLWLDDPIKKGMRMEEQNAVDNFLWSLHNGAARKVRGNQQEPHTAVLATSNIALGEGNTAIESRLLKLHFPVKETNAKSFQALRETMKAASGGIGQLVAIGYPKAEIDNLESRIVEHLHNSHARISQNLALLTYYTQRFCDLAGVEFNALDYCLAHLCPAADDLGSDKDSLTDFLEKLAVLKSQNLIGEWNMTIVKSRDGQQFLALYSPGIWKEFSKQFSVNYSRQTVEKLASQKGAIDKTAKFVDSRLTWIEYQKAKASAQFKDELKPSKPPKSTAHDSLLIPYKIVAPILEPKDEITQQVNSDSPSNPEQITSATQLQQRIQPQVIQVASVTPENEFAVETDNLVIQYVAAFRAAAQQNRHSKAALTRLVEDMQPLNQAIKQRVWDSLPKDVQARIQIEVIGKPLNPKTEEVAW